MSRRLPDNLARRMEATDRPPVPMPHRKIARLLARLQARTSSFSPSSGRQLEPWEVEDALTIASALGVVASKSAVDSLAVAILCMRWWPNYVEGPVVARVMTAPVPNPIQKAKREEAEQPKPRRAGGGVGTLSRLVAVPLVVVQREDGTRVNKRLKVMRGRLEVAHRRTYQPTVLPVLTFVTRALERKLEWKAMPDKVAASVRKLLDSGRLTAGVLDEYVNPTFCPRCKGYGEVLRTKDEEGNPTAPTIVSCPLCLGQAQIARSVGKRSTAVGLRTSTFHRHVQPAHTAVLGLLRQAESRAALSLLRAMGP